MRIHNKQSNNQVFFLLEFVNIFTFGRGSRCKYCVFTSFIQRSLPIRNWTPVYFTLKYLSIPGMKVNVCAFLKHSVVLLVAPLWPNYNWRILSYQHNFVSLWRRLAYVRASCPIWASEASRERPSPFLSRASHTRGGTPIYGLYRYVPLNRVWVLRFSVLK